MRVLLVTFLAAWPVTAWAAPVFLPVRDVAVTYELIAPGRAPENYQLTYDAGRQLVRIDAPAGYYVLGNLPAGQAELVIPALHAVVQAPDFSALTAEIYSADGASFTPLGHGNYAGFGCDTYLVLVRNGSGTACLTPGGVVLHFKGHDARGSAEVTALAVSYPSPPDGFFATPEGFTPLDLPPGAIEALLKQ